MAMTMNGEVQLSATRDKVWAMLNDPEVLKSCIPGCEMLDKSSDTEFQAIASVKVGPVKARWKGKVKLTDLDPPNGYRIVGEGEGGVAGFAKGNARVSLSDKDGGTLLSYDVESQIGGKLAQLGQRLINSAAKKTATISSKNSEPPSQPTHRPHRHVDKSVAEAPWWCLATGASNAHLSVRTKNQTSCDVRHQTSDPNADGPR